jgi:hypothetical protein
LYAYVANSPARFVDPLGLFHLPIGAPPAVIIGGGITIGTAGAILIPALAVGAYIEWKHPQVLDPFFDQFYRPQNSSDDESTYDQPDPHVVDLFKTPWKKAWEACEDEWKEISSGCNVTRQDRKNFMEWCMRKKGF